MRNLEATYQLLSSSSSEVSPHAGALRLSPISGDSFDDYRTICPILNIFISISSFFLFICKSFNRKRNLLGTFEQSIQLISILLTHICSCIFKRKSVCTCLSITGFDVIIICVRSYITILKQCAFHSISGRENIITMGCPNLV
jgi:hypothetical protein